LEHHIANPLGRSDAGLLALLLGANLVALASDVMMSPLYPLLAAHYGVALETVVLLGTPRALAQLGVLFLGPLSERIGRAYLLVGGLALTALAAWAGALAPGLGAMALVQTALGLALAVAAAGIPALVGDRYAYAVRGRALAIIRLAMPLTLIAVVPGLAALAVGAGVVAPFVALGTAATAICVLAAWRLPRAVARGATPSAAAPAAGRHITLRAGAVLVLALCLSLVPSTVFTFLPAWVGNTFANPAVTVSLAIAADGCGALLGVLFSAVLVDRLTKRRAATLGALVAGVFMLLLPATGHAFGLAALIIAGFSGCLEVALVAFMALLSEMAPAARGTVMSLWAVALAGGAALAPVAGRLVWMRWGMAGLGAAGSTLLLAVALALTLVVAAEPGGEPNPS